MKKHKYIKNYKILVLIVGILIITSIGLYFSNNTYHFLENKVETIIFPNTQVGVHAGDNWKMLRIDIANYTHELTVISISGTVVTLNDTVTYIPIYGGNGDIHYETHIVDVSVPYSGFLVRSNLNVGEEVIYNTQNQLGAWSNVTEITERVYFGTMKQVAVVKSVSFYGVYIDGQPDIITTYFYFDRNTGILFEQYKGWIIINDVIPEFSFVILCSLFLFSVLFLFILKKYDRKIKTDEN